MIAPYVFFTEIDLDSPKKDLIWDTIASTSDENAHALVVKITKDGNRIYLTSENATVKCRVIRSDGATRFLTGGVNRDGDPYVVLDESCYAIPGQIECTMIITREDPGDITFTFTAVRVFLTIKKDSTDIVVDPNNEIPSVSEILDILDQMRAVTTQAKNAANSATAVANELRAARDNNEFMGTGIIVRGRFDTLNDLIYNGRKEAGYAYLVGEYNEAGTYLLYVYMADNEEWVNCGTLSAVQGIRGEQGESGLGYEYTATLSGGSWSKMTDGDYEGYYHQKAINADVTEEYALVVTGVNSSELCADMIWVTGPACVDYYTTIKPHDTITVYGYIAKQNVE